MGEVGLVSSFIGGGIRDVLVFVWKPGFILYCFQITTTISGSELDKLIQGTYSNLIGLKLEIRAL